LSIDATARVPQTATTSGRAAKASAVSPTAPMPMFFRPLPHAEISPAHHTVSSPLFLRSTRTFRRPVSRSIFRSIARQYADPSRGTKSIAFS
jgi:hypothetical protein